MIYPKTPQGKQQVAHHYDSLDEIYRSLWGEHLHHGYWETGRESPEEATKKLLDKVCEVAAFTEGSSLCDIGCGYGATSRYFAEKYGVVPTALTISEKQWGYASERNSFEILHCDFLENALPSNHFDRAIAIESSEHMPDKDKFFSEVFRILKPGGIFITLAWLSKEKPNDWEISLLLEPICREGRLPSLGSEPEYKEMMEEAGLELLLTRDLTRRVERTWSFSAARTLRAIFSSNLLVKYLFDKTSSERGFLKTVLRMWLAYKLKALRYVMLVAKKRF
jgi:tocopherol O-methyltransferase